MKQQTKRTGNPRPVRTYYFNGVKDREYAMRSTSTTTERAMRASVGKLMFGSDFERADIYNQFGQHAVTITIANGVLRLRYPYQSKKGTS
jgi:hypothetical protein